MAVPMRTSAAGVRPSATHARYAAPMIVRFSEAHVRPGLLAEFRDFIVEGTRTAGERLMTTELRSLSHHEATSDFAASPRGSRVGSAL
jgi:hypothetical protein